MSESEKKRRKLLRKERRIQKNFDRWYYGNKGLCDEEIDEISDKNERMFNKIHSLT